MKENSQVLADCPLALSPQISLFSFSHPASIGHSDLLATQLREKKSPAAWRGTSWVSSTFMNTFYALFFSVLQEREILGEMKGKSSSTISCDVLSLCQPSSTVKLGRRWECSRQALLGRCCFQIWHFSTLFSSLVLSRNSRKIKKSLTQHLTLAFSTKLWCESHIYYIIWFSKKV